jgi:catalase
VAAALGIEVPDAQPAVRPVNKRAEVRVSPTLSLRARPGSFGIRMRHIAILVADGVDALALHAMHEALAAEGAVPRFVGSRLGPVKAARGEDIDVEVTLETAPSVVFDAVIVPDGEAAIAELAHSGQALEFVKDQYRHCKPILALGVGRRLLEAAGIPPKLVNGSPDPGLLFADDAAKAKREFIAALAKHRHFERQTDPPRV